MLQTVESSRKGQHLLVEGSPRQASTEEITALTSENEDGDLDLLRGFRPALSC